MDQLPLPGFEPRPREAADVPLDEAEACLAPPEDGAPQLEAQIGLFEDHAVVRRELELALARGDFEEAGAWRERLEDQYGPDAGAAYAFLDVLAAAPWRGAVGELLAAWSQADERLKTSPLRQLVRRAFFTRLAAARGARAIVSAALETLPAVVDALTWDDSQPQPGGPARTLLRDALLAGSVLEPADFGEPEVRDLLSEDLSPTWLACLGAIRRLWPMPPLADDDRVFEAECSAFLGEAAVRLPDEPGGRDAHAHLFWRCLQFAQDRRASEALVHEARRRMKRLHPELHALHLRRRVI
jgi:hypothetical protein